MTTRNRSGTGKVSLYKMNRGKVAASAAGGAVSGTVGFGVGGALVKGLGSREAEVAAWPGPRDCSGRPNSPGAMRPPTAYVTNHCRGRGLNRIMILTNTIETNNTR